MTLLPLRIPVAILSWALTRRDPRHRPIALALTLAVIVSAARPLLQALRPDVAARLAARAAGALPPPYVGLARAAWAAEVALALGWSAAQAWAVWRVLKSEGPGAEAPSPVATLRNGPPRLLCGGEALILAALALLSTALFLAYPLLRLLPPSYPAAPALVSLAVQLAAVTLRAHRGPRLRSPAEVCAALIAASSAVEFMAGPWVRWEPWRDWYTQGWIDAVTLAGIAGVSAWWIWRQIRGVMGDVEKK